MRKFCEEEIMRITQKLLMSHNKTLHIEVSEQRIPQVWAINCCSYNTHSFHEIFAFCIFAKFSHFFTKCFRSFSFGEKVCKRKFLRYFAGNPSLKIKGLQVHGCLSCCLPPSFQQIGGTCPLPPPLATLNLFK